MKAVRTRHRRYRISALIAGCLLVSWIVIGTAEPLRAVQRESAQEKEANLKQQATGGLFRKWTFDQDRLNDSPADFAGLSSDGRQATWTVQQDATAPSGPNIVAASSQCDAASCYRLLIAPGLNYEYPDLAVRFRERNGVPASGGVAFGVKDAGTFYAAVVDLAGRTAQVVRVIDGNESVLAQVPVTLKPVDWHSLRVQRNTIISKDFIETFVDGVLVLSVEDQTLGLGQVGLFLRGPSTVYFDSFHAVPLFSHRPLSPPAAY
jgi:hypothetical protein